MALYLAGESVPGDYRDALGTAYYPSFHPPAQYFEAAPDFFQPLKSLGGMLPASPPLPHYSFSRASTFLSQPPPLPAEPFPGLPLPHYAKPQDPFSLREDSLFGAGAPVSPPPLYLGPPHKAARSPEAGALEGQSHRYHFTEEELNAVLYGALRSSQLAGSIHAISGPRLSPASTGKAVSGLCARGCLRQVGHRGAPGRKVVPCCRVYGGAWGQSPEWGAGGPAEAMSTGHRRGHVGLPFPVVFLHYELTPGEPGSDSGSGRRRAQQDPVPLPRCTCTAD